MHFLWPCQLPEWMPAWKYCGQNTQKDWGAAKISKSAEDRAKMKTLLWPLTPVRPRSTLKHYFLVLSALHCNFREFDLVAELPVSRQSQQNQQKNRKTSSQCSTLTNKSCVHMNAVEFTCHSSYRDASQRPSLGNFGLSGELTFIWQSSPSHSCALDGRKKKDVSEVCQRLSWPHSFKSFSCKCDPVSSTQQFLVPQAI